MDNNNGQIGATFYSKESTELPSGYDSYETDKSRFQPKHDHNMKREDHNRLSSMLQVWAGQ